MTADIGERLKTIRGIYNFSQRELARRAGVTNSTISLIEQNRVSPSVDSLKKVLEGFPMSLIDFFTMDTEPKEASFFRATNWSSCRTVAPRCCWSAPRARTGNFAFCTKSIHPAATQATP